MGVPGRLSTCNAGDTSSIPGLERSTGKGIGLSTPIFLSFLVVQLVKNLPATQETWVQSLVWADMLEKGTATENSMDIHGVAKSLTQVSDFHSH